MRCNNCGNEIDDKLDFCFICGNNLKTNKKAKLQKAHTKKEKKIKKKGVNKYEPFASIVCIAGLIYGILKFKEDKQIEYDAQFGYFSRDFAVVVDIIIIIFFIMLFIGFKIANKLDNK